MYLKQKKKLGNLTIVPKRNNLNISIGHTLFSHIKSVKQTYQEFPNHFVLFNTNFA